jgi:hypothetical protein
MWLLFYATLLERFVGTQGDQQHLNESSNSFRRNTMHDRQTMIHFINNSRLLLAHLAGINVHLLQIHIFCYKANEQRQYGTGIGKSFSVVNCELNLNIFKLIGVNIKQICISFVCCCLFQ